MNKIILIFLLISWGATNISSQGIEDDNMVLYMKANVLFESGRYDEAVRMYNQVLSRDENHTPALFMRSKTKYELGAFKGTKNDILLYIEKTGISKEVIKLMANTELKLSNLNAADMYVRTALELDPYDDKMHLLAGDIALKSDFKNEACENFATSAQLGNSRAKQRLEENCLGFRQNSSDSEGVPINENPGSVDEDELENNSEEKVDDGIVTLEEIVREAENSSDVIVKNDEINFTSTQKIEIDSKLNIVISDGLGERDVQTKPSIFMLSDQDGVLVIDLCIDGSGMVTEASFNRELSTIYRSSLTSLALRKAKEFVFSANNRTEQCGKMTYNIKS